MVNENIHILLAMDDRSLEMVLGEFMRARGMEVEEVMTGQEAHDELLKKPFDCCILSANLPRPGGVNVVESVRAAGKEMPAILILGHEDRELILRAYEVGADDVLTKPFSMEILIAKIYALVKRYRVQRTSSETFFMLHSTAFDSVHQTLGGNHLSSRESDLLLMLCRNQNQLVERSRILRALWQEDNYFASRSLSVYINHLRAHLAGTGCEIVAVHGKGYKLINQ